MARVRNPLFKSISGKLGDVVFRQIKGKTYMKSAPKKYNFSKSESAVLARDNFSAAVSLSKFVNSIPDFKKVWSNNKIKGANSYTRLISANSKLTFEGKLTTHNVITPGTVSPNISDIRLTEEGINISFSGNVLTGTLHCIVAASNMEEGKSKTAFFNLKKELSNSFEPVLFELKENEKLMLDSSEGIIFFSAIMFNDGNLNCSSTKSIGIFPTQSL